MDQILPLMSDEQALRQALYPHYDPDVKARAARITALNMARDRHLLPDWDYAYDADDQVVDARPSSSMARTSPGVNGLSDVRWRHGNATARGFYGAEHAILISLLLMDQFVAHLDLLKATVQVDICARFEYCKWIGKLQKNEPEAWSTMLSVAGWLVNRQAEIAMPIVPLAVLLVKRGILDRWCECARPVA